MWRHRITLVVLTAACITRPITAQSVDSVATLNWSRFAGGVALIAAMGALVDDPIAHAFRNSSSAGTLTTARQFARFGDATGAGPIIAGLAITGLVTHHRGLVQAAIRAAESVALGTVVTQTGKYAVGRERPWSDPDLDGTDFQFFHGSPSFPSGHATAAFALATSLSESVHNEWATLGFYALASGTGWARMAEQAHWFTDVVAGAVVGTLSGRIVAGRLRVAGVRAPRLLRIGHGTGLGWTVRLPEGF